MTTYRPPDKIIAIYARVSTAAQEEQQTIQTQLMLLKETAAQRNYHIATEYIDDGWSGDMLARPALDKLRQDRKKKIWEAVLIYDPDRLARRYSYQELVMEELKEAGIEIIFVTIAAPQNSEDKILYGVRGLFAEYERTKISERFRLGKLRKVKEGHILVSEALYGYNYVPRQDKTHGYYTINEDEARVVKMIFTWLVREKLTLRKIIQKLRDMGIKPRKSKRGVWGTSTLSTMLRHKGYIGEAHWGSSYAVVPENPFSKEIYRKVKKSSRKIKPENEWHIIKIPPIVDRVLFEAAQEQLMKNFEHCKRNTANQYLLSHKIYCRCGQRRCGEGPQKGKFLYYRCNDRVNNFPLPRTCFEKGINARTADELAWQKIVSLMTSPKLLLGQLDNWLKNRETDSTHEETDIKAIEQQIARLKEEENRYNKAYGAGVFTVEKLSEYVLPLREKTRSLEEQKKAYNSKPQENAAVAIPGKEAIEAFTLKAKQTLHDLSFEAKRSIILDVVEKIVATQEELQVTGHIPITGNNHVKLFTDDRHGMNTNRNSFESGDVQQIPFELNIILSPTG